MAPAVVVVGAGAAGLMAGWEAARAGARVRVVAAGWGALFWHAGCVDVLGYRPGGELVEDPGAAIGELPPTHPYALVGAERVAEALDDLAGACARAGYPLEGSIERNHLLPTGVGSARPTCLAPATMAAGDLRRPDPMLVVGFDRFPDLSASLVAANLERRGIPARGVSLPLASLRRRRFINASVLAGLLETDELRAEVADEVAPKLGRAARVGFPAVLGIDRAPEVVADLGRRLGVEVFEIPTVPPSIPGMRLHRVLVGALRAAGGRVDEGMEAVGADVEDGRVRAVWTSAAARRRRHPGDRFVLATGGILGGGIVAEEDGALREAVFGLPVEGPNERAGWFRRDFTDDHPVYRAGVRVDGSFRPVDADGTPLHSNLYAAGSALAGADPVRERSVEGIALATGLAAGRAAVRGPALGREATR